MTLHVSLPQELENLVHRQVQSGMYGSASEVVREALREYFNQDSDLSHLKQEIDQIKARLDSGEEELVDGEEFFDDMTDKYGLDG